MTLRTCRRARNGVVAQRSGDGVVLLDLESGTYFALDEVGAVVWQECEAGASAAEAVDAVLEQFDASRDVVEPDVLSLLDELEREGLLERVDE